MIHRFCTCRRFAAIFLIAPCVFLTASAYAEPNFSFGAIADCQYCDAAAGGVRQYRLSPAKLQTAVDKLNTRTLEFTVHLGDFIDRDFASFDVVAPIYDQLTMPHYQVLGNHDFSVDDSKKGAVPARMGLPSRYYDFAVEGWRFVALDGNDVSFHAWPKDSKEYAFAEAYYADNGITSPKWNGAVGEAQLVWLRGVLDKATRADESVVLFCHFPVFPENAHNLWNAAAIVALIDDYPCVKAYINGHNHAGNYGERNGVHYITMKGMVDTEENSFSIVKIADEKITIEGFGREENRSYPIRVEKE